MLDINSVRFLVEAKNAGVKFDSVLTLGHQELNVYPATLRSRFGIESDGRFADPVFRFLGAKLVQSMDVSAFDNPSIVHDLNQTIDSSLLQRFDAVLDGGTLEHVFNFPVAIENCMRMVKVGGRLMIDTGCNGFCGHGFYQFSPDLFWRVLSPENGFTIERMIVHRVGAYSKWFDVADPDEIKARVELVSLLPMQLLIQARRDAVAQIFKKPPQQGDYRVPQDGKPSALAATLPTLARVLNMVRMSMGMMRTHTLRNRKAFKPVKPTA